MMPDAEAIDLSSLEFSIACEHDGCDKPAVIMGRGCGDEAHIAVCGEHYQWIQRVFYELPLMICAVCDRPMLVFAQHFDIRKL
jgi:hypothetical protein